MITRPILFSSSMVRAILSGAKTQTRRVIKPQPRADTFGEVLKGQWMSAKDPEFAEFCPHGQIGDRLWVRETWRPAIAHSHGMDACDCADVNVTYAADGEVRFFPDDASNADWTMPQAARRGNVPGIHMPRWASRITLEVTGVRVERLQDISEEDARAEGCAGGHDSIPEYGFSATPIEHFRHLWRSINGTWDPSLWVWVISFRRVEVPHV